METDRENVAHTKKKFEAFDIEKEKWQAKSKKNGLNFQWFNETLECIIDPKIKYNEW